NALGRGRIATDFEGYIIRKQLLASNTTIWDLNDNLTIKNIFAYQELLNEQGWDGDGTPIPLLQLGRRDELGRPMLGDQFRTISNELQLQGEALDGGLKWLVGVFASEQTTIHEGEYGSSSVFAGIPGVRNPTLRGADDQEVKSLAP